MLNTYINVNCIASGSWNMPVAQDTSITRRKSSLQIVILVTMLLLSLTANAALSTADWKHSGDGALTYDDNSGLWWLDLTETAGMSYSQVSAQLVAGGTYEGWRYATVAEATDIYTQFGLVQGAENLSVNQFKAAIQVMNSYFGDIVGAVADAHGSWAISGTEWDVSYPTWHRMFSTYYYEDESYFESDLGVSFAADLDMSWVYCGSLLVRDNKPVSPVPLPAALALFSTGLFTFGVAGARRRKLSGGRPL